MGARRRGPVRARERRGAPGVGDRDVPPEARDQRRRRRRRHGADRHGGEDLAGYPRLHARHGAPAAGDLPAVRGHPGAVRDPRRVRATRRRRRLAARDGPRAEPDVLVARPAARVLHHPQGRAPQAEARHARRVDRRAPSRTVEEPSEHREGRAGSRSRRHREAEPARGLDPRSRVVVRARARRPVPRAVRPGVHVDRLRAVHAGGPPGRVRARRSLVVGAGHRQGMRDPLLRRAARVQERQRAGRRWGARPRSARRLRDRDAARAERHAGRRVRGVEA